MHNAFAQQRNIQPAAARIMSYIIFRWKVFEETELKSSWLKMGLKRGEMQKMKWE